MMLLFYIYGKSRKQTVEQISKDKLTKSDSPQCASALPVPEEHGAVALVRGMDFPIFPGGSLFLINY